MYALGNVGLSIMSGVLFSIFPTEHKGCSTGEKKKKRHDVAVYENLLWGMCMVIVAAARQQSSVMTNTGLGCGGSC